MSPQLHTDEVPIDTGLVSRLVRDQFPDWADLPIERIDSGGTVNAIFRMGTDLAARLPLAEWGVPAIETEFVWSPRLAPHLPLVVPIPIARGRPGASYPFPWAVHRWLDGEMATDHTVPDLRRAATDVANFVKAFQGIDTAGAPANTRRGVPLVTADQATRAAIGQLGGVVDMETVTAAWERALAAPDWERPPVWTHGDLWHSNLLAGDGRITAVIDFGGVGVGDPAIDMIVAWSLLDAYSRPVFRSELGVDDATWERGRGWAISMAAQAIPYYVETNPIIVQNGHRMIEAVLSNT